MIKLREQEGDGTTTAQDKNPSMGDTFSTINSQIENAQKESSIRVFRKAIT